MLSRWSDNFDIQGDVVRKSLYLWEFNISKQFSKQNCVGNVRDSKKLKLALR